MLEMIGSIFSFNWCLTVGLKPIQPLISFRRYMQFVIQSTLRMPEKAWHYPAKITRSICSLHYDWLHAKNSNNNSTLSRDLRICYFGELLEMSEHPTKTFNFYWCLTVCKTLRQSFHSFQRYWLIVLSEHFEHSVVFMTTHNQNDMINFSYHGCLTTWKKLT